LKAVVASIPDQRPRSGLRVEGQDAVSMVGDKNTAVLVNLEAVGNPVVFGKHRPGAIRRDPEHAPMGEVDAVQVTSAIERRSLQEGVQRTRAALLHPSRIFLGPVQSGRQAGIDFGLDDLRRGIQDALP
jgi:hypothetical protein